MKKLYILLLALLFSFGCTAINDPDPIKPDPATAEITIKTPDVVLSDVEGSTTTAEFTANAAWTIETTDTKATPDWFEVSPKSGNAGDITLSIKATKSNEDYDDRSAYVKIKSGDVTKTITVTQQLGDIGYAEIKIEVTGTLSELLKRYDLPGITTLKLRGIMNYDDFEAVKSLRNLVTLDIENIKNAEIPENALSECTLTNIMLPENLKKIRSSAFSRCPSLTSITIPASVETIDAFSGCSKLANVTFEAGSKLKTIGGKYSSSSYGAFSSCTSLTSITIPASVETIDAFSGCSKLANVTFEAGSKLKTIGGKYSSSYYHGTFSSCTSLTSITIPASVEKIEIAAFSGCSKLASVTFEAGSKLKTIAGGYSSYYDYGAFSSCTSLTSITIPASVETIEASAFKGCSKLTNVTFEAGSKLKTIAGGGYNSYNSSCAAFSNCTSLTSITIPASVETIGAGAFRDCANLASVTFEAGSKLKTIDGEYSSSSSYYGAFSGCTSLTSITIPASVETIGAGAFRDCANLASVTFEAGSKLKTIGSKYSYPSYYGAFSGCTSLTSITIPASAETIERATFSDCTSLMTVDASKCELITNIGSYAFSNCTKLNLFKIGTVIPPTRDWGAFSSMASSSVLKVPAGSVNAYKAASGWKDSFATITALD